MLALSFAWLWHIQMGTRGLIWRNLHIHHRGQYALEDHLCERFPSSDWDCVRLRHRRAHMWTVRLRVGPWFRERLQKPPCKDLGLPHVQECYRWHHSSCFICPGNSSESTSWSWWYRKGVPRWHWWPHKPFLLASLLQLLFEHWLVTRYDSLSISLFVSS